MTFKFTTTIAALLVAASVATAQQSSVPGNGDDTSTSPGDSNNDYDLHDNNRAVAFGSVLLHGNGSDYDKWQAIQAWSPCQWPIPIPSLPVPGQPGSGTGSGNSQDPTDPTDPFPCDNWDVMVTMDYRLEVCPDGRAFIARSGDGVIVTDRHTGEFYAWTESYGCENDIPELKGAAALDSKRPLNRKFVKKVRQ